MTLPIAQVRMYAHSHTHTHAHNVRTCVNTYVLMRRKCTHTRTLTPLYT